MDPALAGLEPKIRDAYVNVKRNESTTLAALVECLRLMRRVDPGAKAAVFTQFAASLQRVESCLSKELIKFVKLDGSVVQKRRAKNLQLFKEDKDTVVFVMSLRSGAVGLTLTAASHCFLLDTVMNEGTELQAVNRIHRLGQTKNVKITHFVIQDSIEARILHLRTSKKKRDSGAKKPAADGASSSSGDGASSSTEQQHRARPRQRQQLRGHERCER